MRTTLDIDEDVLQAAKEIARRDKKTAGEVLSALARNALTGRREAAGVRRPRAVCGFRPFPRRGSIVTNALVDSLRDGDV